MTNKDLAQSTRPFVDYIKTQIPCITDRHAETLAAQIIARLPYLFAERPEIFSRVLSMSGSHLFTAYREKSCIHETNPRCSTQNSEFRTPN